MRTLLLVVVALGLTAGAAAQSLPAPRSEPVTLGGGRVVIGADVAVAIAPEDRGFFNYGDYEQTTVRQLRLGMSGLVRVTERISILGELRSENLDRVEPFALYARLRPFPDRKFDIQVGRIPPTFGSFSRRTYSHDNPLIGHPLGYQYLTSLRPDAVPAHAEELLGMRGRGWLSNYSTGNRQPHRGVPLVSALTWDTGVQVTSGWRMLTFAAAITNGTASNPRVADDNTGKQLVARLTAAPIVGLVIGTSVSQGEFLARSVRNLVPAAAGERYPQRALGADVEYSRDRWVVRADTVLSEWQVPFSARGPTPVPLRALATSLEGRYTILPGLYGAARAEHLGFSRIGVGARRDEWDAPVTRFEVGGGYYLQRNVIARVSLQTNTRDGGRITRSRFVAGQLLYWF